MRYLVIADVHGNAPALEAVLRDARRRGFDEAVFLGDLVGYYPYASEVVALLQGLAPAVRLLGNHDALLLRIASGDDLAGVAEEAGVVHVLRNHVQDLDADAQAFLGTLTATSLHEGWAAAHGGFRRPFDYVTTIQQAQEQIDHLPRRIALVGHTHVPRAHVSVELDGRRLWRSVDFAGPKAAYRVPPQATAILNPGAVGQPRDGDPAAAYALFHPASGAFDVHRVGYDISAVLRRIRSAGYADALARRLLAAR